MGELLDLNWDVFVTPDIPTVTSDLPPGTTQHMWSPISSTLIYGKRDAVLVDAFITVEREDALVDWVAASGKNLTMIYATHGHGDHFFGASTVLQRFPHARLVATPDVGTGQIDVEIHPKKKSQRQEWLIFQCFSAFGAPWRKGGWQAVFRHYLFGRTRFPELVEKTVERNRFWPKALRLRIGLSV